MSAPATILNVNDHEQTRYLVSRILKMSGFHVMEACTGEEALRLVERAPALIILDIKLPDISGLEVCRMIKSRPETASIFVLQTSATFVTAERKVAGLDSGADGYLTHPFEAAELIATVRSLLRLKDAEEALRTRAEDLLDADRRKDEFLATLAHELRNPLAAISGATNLLQAARNDEAKFARLKDILQRQGKHLARLIDDLLDVSRMTRNKIVLKRERCDLKSQIDDALQARSAMIDARGQRLVTNLEQHVHVDGDCTRLNQIFENLLDNASKYSPKGGEIRVSLARATQRGRPFAVVRVEDDGVGIAPSFLPHVFELFAQADESLERSRGGLGIGLTLVKRLAELHGGDISAHSSGLREGSAFELWLPALPEDTVQAMEPAPVPTEKRKRRVLIVEDNRDAAEMLDEYLRHLGHDVVVMHDGASGVEAAITGAFDLGLVDIGLPELDGYQVAERIRASPRGKAMALVALTGYGSPEQHGRALAAGFDRHVLKPIDPRLLEELLVLLWPPARRDTEARA